MFIAVMVMVSFAFMIEASAQQKMAWRGGGGWGPGTPYARMYNPQTVEVITGEVASIDRIRPERGMSDGVHIIVKTDKETIPVHLGPTWYIENQDVKIAPKDKVEVKGSRITYDGKPALIAAEVKKGDEVLTLRDANGFPAWSGWRRGALEGGRLKESVAEQKRINRYFHAVVVPKLKPCWDQLQGKGTIEMKFRYEDNAKGEWAFKTLEGGKSNLPKGQDEAALACMQKAVTATSFPREKSDTGASYSINWDWPVPLPQDAAQRVERMLGSSGGAGTGCDGEGASARCVKCSGSSGDYSCPYVCVGYDSCTIPAPSPDPTVIRMCQQQGKCASGGPFGVVGGIIMY